jgi:hypothetical protein
MRWYGTIREDAAPSRAERRSARTAVLLGAVSLAVLVVAGHVATRTSHELLLSTGSEKELERLERETFESPDKTYDKMLSQLRHTKVSQGAALEAADAWVSHSLSQAPKSTAATAAARTALPDLEHRIAADVSKSLAKTVAQELAKALAASHQAPLSQHQRQQEQQQQLRLRPVLLADEQRKDEQRKQAREQANRARAQSKLLVEVQQQVEADASKLDKDRGLLHWVADRVGLTAQGSKMLVRHKLMHTFAEPTSSIEPSYNDLPFAEGVTSATGPSGMQAASLVGLFLGLF